MKNSIKTAILSAVVLTASIAVVSPVMGAESAEQSSVDSATLNQYIAIAKTVYKADEVGDQIKQSVATAITAATDEDSRKKAVIDITSAVAAAISAIEPEDADGLYANLINSVIDAVTSGDAEAITLAKLSLAAAAVVTDGKGFNKIEVDDPTLKAELDAALADPKTLLSLELANYAHTLYEKIYAALRGDMYQIKLDQDEAGLTLSGISERPTPTTLSGTGIFAGTIHAPTTTTTRPSPTPVGLR